MSKSLIKSMDGPPENLAMEIAEYESSKQNPYHTLEEIAEHFDLTIEQIEHFKTIPSFRAEVRACIEVLKDTHGIIRNKARAQLEFYIDNVVPKLIGNPDTPPSEITKMLQFLAKLAKIIDDPAEKAKVEAEAQSKLPQQSAPTLNLYLSTGKDINQAIPIDIQAERIPNVESEDK